MTTDGKIDSSPVIRDGTLYIVGGDRHVLALDAGTGKQRWISAAASYAGSPAISDDTLIALGADGSIAALSRTDGALVWRTDGDLGPNASPLVIDGVVVSGGSDGVVRGFDALTGLERWSVPTDGDLPRAAAGADGRVFIGSHDGSLYAIDATTGTVAWTLATGAEHFATPAVRSGVVYAMGGPLYAVGAEDGRERWRFTPPDGRGMHSPSVDGDAVYISTDRTLYALSLDDGSVLWSFKGGQWNTAGIGVAGNDLYSFVDGGYLYGVDKASGMERWRLNVHGTVASGTTIADGWLFAGNAHGEVFALGAATP